MSDSRKKKTDWRACLNTDRKGASYFTALVNVLQACPSGYFEHRGMTTETKEAITQEWEKWMVDFSQSGIQVLRDVSSKVHNIDDDARRVLANRIVKNHKINLLQESSEQVHHVSKELTQMVRNAPAPLSICSIPPDPGDKSWSAAPLGSPCINPSSTADPSLSSTAESLSSSSLSRGRERPGDALAEAIKRRRLEKGPVTFRSLVDIAHAFHFGIYEALPESTEVQDTLSPRHQTLCRLSLSYLKKASNRTKYTNPEYNLPLKDAFVSLSGIWNMFCPDANTAFKDDYKQGLEVCAVKELDTPDMEFAAVVAPLIEIAECATRTETGVKAQPLINKIYQIQAAPGSEPYRRSLDALKTILKHAERPLSGRARDASEGDAVSLWSAVFREQLPATASLALNLLFFSFSGEQGLAAARQSNVDLLEIFGIMAGTRKCDSIMTVDDLEVANFELKKGMCTDIQDDIQLRRTIKAMKSILLILSKYGLDCPPVCCMRGMEATAFSVKKLDDIWVAGPACDKIILPQTEAEILDFMTNDMHRLFKLLVWYDRYSREVVVKKAEYERQLRRSSKVALPLPSEEEKEKESRDLEWDLLVLNSPSKQAGRRKSIVEQLRNVEEDFVPSSPSYRRSLALKSIETEGGDASRLRPKSARPKAFLERLKGLADDEAEEFSDTSTC